MDDDRKTTVPLYLAPYARAAARHGGGFGALLWASPLTQGARFDAILKLYDFNGRSMLDVGCGRADLIDYLVAHGVRPADYVGLEAIPELAAVAEEKSRPGMRIVRGDFVLSPALLDVGADVIVFSGSLNTLSATSFYTTLRLAVPAAREAVVFNFLSSPTLAAADHLTWHLTPDVLKFAGRLAPAMRCVEDYMPGDCTIALYKRRPRGDRVEPGEGFGT